MTILLSDLCDLIVDCEHKTAPLSSEGIPSIRTPNIGRGRLILEGVNRVDEETFSAWTRRAVPQADDLIIAREAPVGNVAIVPKDLRVCLGQRTVLVRPNPSKVVPAYLCYFLLGDYAQRRFHSSSVGSTVAHLNMRDIRNLPIPTLPALNVQRRIASILEAYDDLIEINRRQVVLLENMARSLFEEWFVRFRFPGYEDVKIVESLDGPLPEGWLYASLPDAVEIMYGFPFKSKGFSNIPEGSRVVRIRDVPNGRTSTWTHETFDPKYGVVDGDLLVGMDGIFHTAVWVGGPASLNQRVARLRPLQGRSVSWTLHSVLPKIKFFEATISGTTVAHLGAKHLNSIKVPIAAQPLQDRADSFFASIDLQLIGLRKANDSLAVSRDLLLPRLISGQLSIAAAEREMLKAA